MAVARRVVSTAENCTCPAGFYYDAVNGFCVNNNDPEITIDAICVPVDTGPTTDGGDGGDNGGDGGSTGGTSNIGPVNVNLTQTINLAQQDLQNVTDAIEQGIAAGANAASDIAKETSGEIVGSVGNIVTAIGNGVQSFFGSLWQAIQAIASQLAKSVGDIITGLASGIGDVVSKIAGAVANAIGPLVSSIGTFIQDVQTYNTQVLQPILTGVSQTIQTIGALTTAIERDLSNGIQGILQLPGDISNGLSSLDSTISRMADQLGANLNRVVTTTIGGTSEDTIWTRLKGLNDNITAISGYSNLKTTFSEQVKVPEPSITQAGSATIAALWSELEAVASSIVAGGSQTMDGLKSSLPIISALLGITAEGPAYLVSLLAAAVAVFWPYFEFVKGDIASKAGLSKLDVKSALDAWVRGFVTTETLNAELAFTGLDGERIQVMKDLRNYLIDNQAALDMWFRGIISDEDLVANASEHGITSTDLSALQGAAYKLFNVGTATTALRWGIITDEQHTQVLKENRYTENEITAIKLTLYELESDDDVINRLRVSSLYSGLGFSPSDFADVPPELSAAINRAGFNAQVALDRWQRSFYVPQIREAFELWFKGTMSLGQLNGVLDYYKVPTEYRSYLLSAHQSLIPWRTIPTMLANGIITEQYAKQQLQAHGFDLPATEALLSYAAITKAKAKAVQLGNPLDTSISAAKELWSIGAFTDAQYTEALEAHGYTAEQAELVIASEKVAAEAKDRKQVALDITNEVLAGLITVDDARQQMAGQNFTMAETAKVLKSIARVQRSTSKTPSEAELTKMAKAGAIQFTDWSAAMAILGYAQKWIDAFAVLNFGSANGPQTLVTGTQLGQ